MLDAGSHPHHRSQKKQDLDNTVHDLNDIPEPGSQNPKQNPDPVSVQDEQADGQRKEQDLPARIRLEQNHHHKHNHHVVTKNNDVTPQHPEDMNAKRHWNLLDNPFRLNEDRGTFIDKRGNHGPYNHPRGKIGQIRPDLLMKEFGIQHTHHRNRDPETQGDPERTKRRSPVALLDVLPPQRHP